MNPTQPSAHYENCLMLDADGTPLSTVSRKRVKWYISRGLAKPVADHPDQRFHEVIQLTFAANRDGPVKASDIEFVENRCVVCGAPSNLSLHHVVSHRVRRLYALEDKERRRQDCVLLCQAHHQAADELTVAIDPHILYSAWVSAVLKRVASFLNLFRRIYFRMWLLKQGGPAGLNSRYYDAFMTLKPKYLPKGWLE